MSKKCKVCGRSCYDYQKLKTGIICSDCLNTLPIGVKNCIREFTGDQIQKIQKVAKPFDGKSKIWRYCVDLKVCVDSIVLNRMEYKFKDLESVKLNFHPKEIGKMPDTAEGIVTVVIEIKSPHVLIEEAGNRFFVFPAFTSFSTCNVPACTGRPRPRRCRQPVRGAGG